MARAARKVGADGNGPLEIRLRAERRGGEMLAAAPRHRQEDGRPGKALHDETHTPTLRDFGLTRVQAHRWQRNAGIPDEQFEKYVVGTQEAGAVPNCPAWRCQKGVREP